MTVVFYSDEDDNIFGVISKGAISIVKLIVACTASVIAFMGII